MSKFLSITYILFGIISVFSQKQITSYHGEFEVFQEKDSTFTIYDGKKTLKFKNLKYAFNAGRGLQIITADNNIKFLDIDLSEIETPKPLEFGYCGTVESFKLKIEKQSNTYKIIKYNYGYADYNPKNIIDRKILNTIDAKNVKDIYFTNKSKEAEYDENFYFPSTVIIEYEDKLGITTDNGIKYFDDIKIENDNIKTKKNNKWGYFEISDCIFDRLDEFNYNLAYFEQGDKKGYLDFQGNLYYCN